MTQYTIYATAANAVGNIITVSSVGNMFSGLPIVFSGNTFGGITANATYYVGTVIPGYPTSTITVSSLPGGATYAVANGTGNMTAVFSQGGQQIINTVPPGESLTDAFTAVNVNFDQVFAAGPVNSNIQIANNTILTTNTNGNINLVPNGVGTVVVNGALVPDHANVRTLGSANNRFSTIYAQYFNMSGNLSVPSLSVSGNVTGNYFFGNGSQLTGISGGGNATAINHGLSNVSIPVANGNVYINTNAGSAYQWVYDTDGYVTMPLTTRLNSGGIGVTDSAEFGTQVTSNGTAITGSQIYMGAGTAESRAIVNQYGNSLMYTGVETPGFAGLVSMDPGVTSEYAIQVGTNNEIQIGAVIGAITTTEYVAGLGVLNNTGNINGLFANANVVVIGAGNLGWKFDNAGNITVPGNVVLAAASSVVLDSSTGNAYISQTMGLQIAGEAGINFSINDGEGSITNAGFDTYANFSTPGNISATGNVTAAILQTTGSLGNITGANVVSANEFVTPYSTLNNGLSTTGNIFGNSITLKNTDDFAQVVFSSDGGSTNNGQIKVDGGTNMIISANNNFYVKRVGQDRIAVTDTTSDFMAAANVRIQSNKTGSAYIWTFDTAGNLLLPGGHSSLGISNSGYLTTLGNDATSVAVDGDNGIVTLTNPGATYTFVDSFNSTSGANVLTLTTRNGDANPNRTKPQIIMGYAGTTDYAQYIHTIHNVGNPAYNTIDFYTSDGTQAGTFPANAVLGLTVTNGNIVTGGIFTDHYYYANGIPVSFGGSYGNSNVTTLLANFGSNTISTAGNITSNYILGNGSQLTGLPATYGNANVTNLLSNLGSNTVSTTGNIYSNNVSAINAVSANSLIAGTQTTTTSSGGNLVLTQQSPQNQIFNGTNSQTLTLPATTVTGLSYFVNNNSSGNIIVKNSTGTTLYTVVPGADSEFIYTGSGTYNWDVHSYLPSGATYGSALFTVGTTNGIATTAVSATGNITGNYILGNGSQLTGLPATYGNSNVTTLLAGFGSNTISTTGNITAGNLIGNINVTGNVIGTSANVTLVAGAYTWTFDNTGNLNIPAGGDINLGNSQSIISAAGNITGNYIFGNGSQLTGLPATYGNSNVTTLLAGFGSNSISTTGNITAGNLTGNISIAGNVVGAQANVGIVAGSYTWTFDNTGNLTLPVNGDLVFSANTTLGSQSASNGNITINPDGTGQLIVTSTTPAQFGNTVSITGNLSVTGNILTPNRPAFRVYGNSSTIWSTTTNTNGILNANNWVVDYNQGGYLNSSTGVFTAPVAGLYQLNLVCRVANNTSLSAQAIVIKNYGSGNVNQVMWESANNPTINHFGVSTTSKLAAGDTLTLKITVGSLIFDSNDNWSVAFLG